MKNDCPGLRHEWEGAGIYCPKRAPEEPEDGDWERLLHGVPGRTR